MRGGHPLELFLYLITYSAVALSITYLNKMTFDMFIK